MTKPNKRNNPRRRRAIMRSPPTLPFQSVLTQVKLLAIPQNYPPIPFNLSSLLPELHGSSTSSRLVRLQSLLVRFYPTPTPNPNATQTFTTPLMCSVQLLQFDTTTNMVVPKTNIIPLSTTVPRVLYFRATGSRWFDSYSAMSVDLVAISVRSTIPELPIYCDITSTFQISRDGVASAGSALTTAALEFEPIPTVQQITTQMSRGLFRAK